MRTHKDLVSAWGTQKMADDLGTNYGAVASWKQRNSIPFHWFTRIVAMAPVAGFPQVTLPYLHSLRRGASAAEKSTRTKKNASAKRRTLA